MMGCAPSATTATTTSPRMSLTDDKKLTATDGLQAAAAAAAATGTDAMSSTDNRTTRVNGDVPLTKASGDIAAGRFRERVNE